MIFGARLLHAGAPERKRLDAVRAQLATAAEALDEILGARLPVDEALQRFQAAIAPDVERAKEALLGFASPEGGAPRPAVDALVVAALLQPAEFEQRMRSILAAPPGKAGLPAAERRKKIAELEAKISQLETTEEEEIIKLELTDCVVERRLEVPIDRLLKVWAEL